MANVQAGRLLSAKPNKQNPLELSTLRARPDASSLATSAPPMGSASKPPWRIWGDHHAVGCFSLHPKEELGAVVPLLGAGRQLLGGKACVSRMGWDVLRVVCVLR